VPKINIEREHGKTSIDDVKADVQELADKLSEKFDLTCRWKGDNLEFKRTGAEGRIEVDARRVRLVMKLSMLLAPIRGEVERRTNMYMDQYFEKVD
jgi:putative polyhydroxyalkanoate system protein